MSLGCASADNIVYKEVQDKEDLRSDLLGYWDKILITINIMQDLYRQEFQEAKKSINKYWIKINRPKNYARDIARRLS